MDFKKCAEVLVSKMTLAEKMSQMKFDAPAIKRLDIPAYNWWSEGLHGVSRSGTATVFPQSIAMAASFNIDLMFTVATAISDEARAKYNEYKKFGETLIYQGLTYWSPNINIFRDPRWGRGHETYGEDPYLTGEMGVAYIKGMQGQTDNGPISKENTPKYRKLDATIKHYAVHSGPESGRHSFNSVVNEKDLYETYLWAFKYCIDNADPSAVMGSYNRINGEPACGSKTYLKGVLYNDFGFNGYVVSDCGAICDINNQHKVTKNEAESAALAVNNGCQLNCGSAYKWLKVAVAEGMITEQTITKSVEKLFESRFRLGMFDNDCVYDKISYDIVACEKHKKLNLEMSQESIVLLKNNGILPLKTGNNIAIIGPNADDKSVLLGNYNGMPKEYVTILKGILNECNGKTYYAKGCHITKDILSGWEEQPLNEAIICAKYADIIIFCCGLNPTIEGEEGDAYNADLSGDKASINLPVCQLKLLRELAKVGKPIVTINISGSCVDLTEVDHLSSAVIQCFYPGSEGGTAVANVIFGKTNPSGRLPVTFYGSNDELPDFEDYSMENRTYKFFKGTPLYPFGYGLNYSNVTEEWMDDNTVKLKNNSDLDVNYSVLKYEYIPHKSLCAFKKVLVKKREEVQITI